MSDELAEVRLEVAAGHGLPAGAAPLLQGETVAQIEESATAFARLVHTGGSLQHEPEPAGRNIFAEAAAGKQARKQELHRLITGRPTEQPRDEHGRFAAGLEASSTVPNGTMHEPRAAAVSFDGGARPLVPRAPATGEQLLAEHGRWVGEVVRGRRGDQGIRF